MSVKWVEVVVKSLPLLCSPVIREWSCKKIQIEKKQQILSLFPADLVIVSEEMLH